MALKFCSKCKTLKSLYSFSKDASKKDGLYSSCKECSIKKNKKYRYENKEKISLWHKQYRTEKPEIAKECSAKSYIKNRAKIIVTRKEHQQKNKDVYMKRYKNEYQKNKDKPGFQDRMRNSAYKRHFGITIQDYDDMYIEQGGRCATCGTHQSKLGRRLHIDHCHKTGIVRGLLCHNCNVGIGNLKDDITIMKNIIKYLERVGG